MALEGYHHAQDENGTFAIEENTPCEGAVTLTWVPQEYPGKKCETVMPQELFVKATEGYLRELGRKPRKAPQPAETTA